MINWRRKSKPRTAHRIVSQSVSAVPASPAQNNTAAMLKQARYPGSLNLFQVFWRINEAFQLA